MHLGNELGLLDQGLNDLADAYRRVAEHHREEPDVRSMCGTFATDCDRQIEGIGRFVSHYGEESVEEPDQMYAALFRGARSGGLGLLRDLQDVYVLAHLVDITWTVVGRRPGGCATRTSSTRWASTSTERGPRSSGCRPG